MKKIFFLLIVSATWLHGQADRFYDISGQPFFPVHYENVNGTPYLFDDWMVSRITLKGGRILDQVKTNLHLMTKELHYLDARGNIMIANGDFIELLEVSGKQFIAHSPAGTFFEVLAPGNAMLLKQYYKVLMETKPYNSATVEKNFILQEQVFLFYGGKMTEINRADDLLQVLDTDHSLEHFVKSAGLKRKSKESWIRMVGHFNEEMSKEKEGS